MSVDSSARDSSVSGCEPEWIPLAAVRIFFWSYGLLLALAQTWVFRYQVSSDSVSYLDMSDGVLPGGHWRRLINGVWSPLYPFLLGLVRRVFTIGPANEIAAGHFLNILFFVFAFAAFELLLGQSERLPGGPAGQERSVSRTSFPVWARRSVAYALFLWLSIDEISLRNLRPDMLMSGFLYLSVAILLAMRKRPARWRDFLLLGAVLGIGFLAKEPMLPIGILVLALAVLTVQDWRPALKMAISAAALVLVIGGIYYLPLSEERHRFTLGESGSFNYEVHVDDAGPSWYLQNPGRAGGHFQRSPQKIFEHPAAYAFSLYPAVTHPLRFDPSDWVSGLRPRFALKPQLKALIDNVAIFREILQQMIWPAIAVALLLVFSDLKRVTESFRARWQTAAVGTAGCVMFALVHVEPRYVAGFLLLISVTLLDLSVPRKGARTISAGVVLIALLTLLIPVTRQTYVRHRQGFGRINTDAEAAEALQKIGLAPGDGVAKISPLVYDLGAERIARVEVVAEVDYEQAADFWKAPLAVQDEVVRTLLAHGAKVVIATMPQLTSANRSEWVELGSTGYWVWKPSAHA